MANIFMNGDELAKKSDLLKSKAVQYKIDQFDANDGLTGVFPFNDLKPNNLPDNTSNWGILFSFPLSENDYSNNIIQFVFDTAGLAMYRTKDGSSGVMTWNAWKQIGGY